MIRVLVVDDQTLVRRGLAELLAGVPDITIVGEAADGEEALRLARERGPDVVLLDVRMPEMSGLEVLDELRAKNVASRALMLTTFDDDSALLEAVRRGAKGYLLKDATLEELAQAIRVVAAGGTYVRPVVTTRVLQGLRELQASGDTPPTSPAPPTAAAGPRGADAGADVGLTPREVEILRLMAGGYSNREIAGALAVAEGTIKNHVSSILSKMGVRDRTRAVLKGLELGCI